MPASARPVLRRADEGAQLYLAPVQPRDKRSCEPFSRTIGGSGGSQSPMRSIGLSRQCRELKLRNSLVKSVFGCNFQLASIGLRL
jgi:hypothetical protein